jgi:hypothetical protein
VHSIDLVPTPIVNGLTNIGGATPGGSASGSGAPVAPILGGIPADPKGLVSAAFIVHSPGTPPTGSTGSVTSFVNEPLPSVGHPRNDQPLAAGAATQNAVGQGSHQDDGVVQAAFEDAVTEAAGSHLAGDPPAAESNVMSDTAFVTWPEEANPFTPDAVFDAGLTVALGGAPVLNVFGPELAASDPDPIPEPGSLWLLGAWPVRLLLGRRSRRVASRSR